MNTSSIQGGSNPYIRAIDTNRDGRVQQGEGQAFLETVLKGDVSLEDARQGFEAMRKANNGQSGSDLMSPVMIDQMQQDVEQAFSQGEIRPSLVAGARQFVGSLVSGVQTTMQGVGAFIADVQHEVEGSDAAFNQRVNSSTGGPPESTHLENTNNLTMAEFREVHGQILSMMQAGGQHSLAGRLREQGYSEALLSDATLASAFYENQAKTVFDDVMDHFSGAKDVVLDGAESMGEAVLGERPAIREGITTAGSWVHEKIGEQMSVHASMGPFQAYASHTADALLESPQLVDFLAHGNHNDPVAREFAQGLLHTFGDPAHPGQLNISHDDLTAQLSGPMSPLHSSDLLSLTGKIHLTMEWIADIHNLTEGGIRHLDKDSQLQVIAETEVQHSSRGPEFTTQFANNPDTIQLESLGNPRIFHAMERLGIGINTGNTATYQPISVPSYQPVR